MGHSGKMIADAASMGPRYANRLLDGIPADRFARLATPGNQTIQANHPAFILGHLGLYPVKVLQLLGLDTAPVEPRESYTRLFSKDATCQDDPGGEIYPAADEIIDFFNKSYQAAVDAMRDASDEQLAAENPVDTPMKSILPTLGAMLAFYLNGHVMVHLGQLSTWRRMQGLPPA